MERPVLKPPDSEQVNFFVHFEPEHVYQLRDLWCSRSHQTGASASSFVISKDCPTASLGSLQFSAIWT